ncbi:hypothetical protein PRVXH_002610 [Proteinivorax hydrogeniformans]|uniref:Uncharacterized protein n=1 Tax=Proteinivorax hydrogeniformans TaxID=1826727 RepID=A0AAU8HTU6_9FIRM
MGLEDIKKSGEEFLIKLGRDYYYGGSGKKKRGDFQSLYDEYKDLFSLETIKKVQSLKQSGCTEDAYLISFLIKGYLGREIQAITKEIYDAELNSHMLYQGKETSLRFGKMLLSIEQDREKRLQLDELVTQKQVQFNYLRKRRIRKLKECANKLGYQNYLNLIEDVEQIDTYQLIKIAKDFLIRTEDVYLKCLSFLNDYIGNGEQPIRKSDIAFIFKSNNFANLFPELELVPSIEDTFYSLGINVHQQDNLKIDYEKNESKSPTPFCCPIKVPDEIHLVLNPTGGIDDYQNSLHEAGQCQFLAHIDKALPMEFKRMGDKSIRESYGLLFQFLTLNEKWINRFLNFDNEKSDYLTFAWSYKLYVIRRYCGKLMYEAQLYSKEYSEKTLEELYENIMSDAVKLDVSKNNYLLDLDLGFNTPEYLKSWALENSLRSFLTSNYGENWFEKKEAGKFLQALWKSGTKYNYKKMIAKLGFTQKDLADLLIEQFSDILER